MCRSTFHIYNYGINHVLVSRKQHMFSTSYDLFTSAAGISPACMCGALETADVSNHAR